MNFISSSQSQQTVNSGFRVDISRGQRIGRVSSEWFSRPDDERYLSLAELYDAVKTRADRAKARTVESRAVRVEASRENSERLALIVPGQDQPVAPTHWSFGQLCSLVGAPATYMRQLPAPLAGINLQHGLLSHRAELVKTLEGEDGRIELRAVTGPDYGRIWDHELVAAVMRIAGNGRGDTMWKVPGMLDWPRSRDRPRLYQKRDAQPCAGSHHAGTRPAHRSRHQPFAGASGRGRALDPARPPACPRRQRAGRDRRGDVAGPAARRISDAKGRAIAPPRTPWPGRGRRSRPVGRGQGGGVDLARTRPAQRHHQADAPRARRAGHRARRGRLCPGR